MTDTKTKFIPQWVVNLAIMLIMGAYGFIFTGILSQIQENSNGVKECFVKIETLNPTFSQIQADLSSIRTNQEWIKNKLNER